MLIIVVLMIFLIQKMQCQLKYWMILIIHVLFIEQVEPRIQWDYQNSPVYSILDNKTAIKYHPSNALKSSVTILADSLTPNKTYQFVVYMVNRRNSSFQAAGYVLVKIEYTKPQLIAIAYVLFFYEEFDPFLIKNLDV